MRHNAEALARRGFLRQHVGVRQAAETMWLYHSPELYRLLVIELGSTDKDRSPGSANPLEDALLTRSTDSHVRT